MKALLVLCIVMASYTTIDANTFFKREVKPSGDNITKTYNIPASKFDKIDVSSVANVKIVTGSGDIIVNIDSNLAEYLVVELDGDELEIGLDYNGGTGGKFTFDVTVPYRGELSELSTSGASKIKSDIVLTGDHIAIDASGASKIIALVRGIECSAKASGAAYIEVAGQCGTFEIDISGAANAKAYINSDKCDIEASGASNLLIEGDSDFVGVDVSGASKISIIGECNHIEFEASGASNIDATELKYTSIATNKSGAAKITYQKRGDMIISNMGDDIERVVDEVIEEIEDIEVEQIKAEVKEMAKKIEEKIEKVIDEVKKEMKDIAD